MPTKWKWRKKERPRGNKVKNKKRKTDFVDDNQKIQHGEYRIKANIKERHYSKNCPKWTISLKLTRDSLRTVPLYTGTRSPWEVKSWGTSPLNVAIVKCSVIIATGFFTCVQVKLTSVAASMLALNPASVSVSGLPDLPFWSILTVPTDTERDPGKEILGQVIESEVESLTLKPGKRTLIFPLALNNWLTVLNVTVTSPTCSSSLSFKATLAVAIGAHQKEENNYQRTLKNVDSRTMEGRKNVPFRK